MRKGRRKDHAVDPIRAESSRPHREVLPIRGVRSSVYRPPAYLGTPPLGAQRRCPFRLSESRVFGAEGPQSPLVRLCPAGLMPHCPVFLTSLRQRRRNRFLVGSKPASRMSLSSSRSVSLQKAPCCVRVFLPRCPICAMCSRFLDLPSSLCHCKLDVVNCTRKKGLESNRFNSNPLSEPEPHRGGKDTVAEES